MLNQRMQRLYCIYCIIGVEPCRLPGAPEDLVRSECGSQSETDLHIHLDSNMARLYNVYSFKKSLFCIKVLDSWGLEKSEKENFPPNSL